MNKVVLNGLHEPSRMRSGCKLHNSTGVLLIAQNSKKFRSFTSALNWIEGFNFRDSPIQPNYILEKLRLSLKT